MPPVKMRTHLNWEDVYDRHGPALARFEELLQTFEEEHRIDLSPGAVEMLLLPLVETLEMGRQVDLGELDESFRSLLRAISDDPDPRDNDRLRCCWSVARAYASLWCSIPPFCSPG